MVKLLEPFETITRRLSGAKYPTLNMVHPYIYMLKRTFAPKIQENETIDSYLDLVYGPLMPENVEDDVDVEDDSSSISDDNDDILTAGNQQHWQYAKQQFREQMRNQRRGRGHNYRYNRGRGRSRGCGYGHGHGHDHILQSSYVVNNEIENSNQIEYLPPVDTKNLLKKIHAAIYLSLDNLWNVPNELSLIATILDPRMKNFPFIKDSYRKEQKALAETLLKDLYIQLKQNLALLEEINKELSPILVEKDDNIFAEM